MHQEILVSITDGHLGTTETELTKYTSPHQKCIQFIYEVLNNNILWNMKIIFIKYFLHE